MTNKEKEIKDLLDNFDWNENNIPIELIISMVEFRKKVLSLSNPVFTKDNIPVMNNWNDFKYTGLDNIDYITTNFYK